MLRVLRTPSYAKLFAAQVVALLGTGLLTIALGLLAFQIAGGDAGIVLGTALTIKMVAYVFVSPLMAAITGHLPRKILLVGADVIRAGVAISLPFVTEAWQIYLLIFLLQAASATFTPAFQSVIPEILSDEREYTRALSLSRLAYDLESLISPILAAALLVVVRFNDLFVGTCVGFLASAVLVLVTRFPHREREQPSPFFERLTRGVRVFAMAPELRALLAMNLVVAASTAMVIVNTVVLVQAHLNRPQTDVALLLASYGAGSMLVALAVPRILDRLPDRPVMLTGAFAIPIGLVAVALVVGLPDTPTTWLVLLGAWLFLGAATSLILTPSSRLLRRATDDTSRPSVFVAQFSLSHACFMFTYPAAGFLGAQLGLPVAAGILALLAFLAATIVPITWRNSFPRLLPRGHQLVARP